VTDSRHPATFGPWAGLVQGDRSLHDMAADLLIGLVAFLASWLGTLGVLRYAHARDLLDHPNERSSHAAPTARGGGLAIVLSFLAGLVALHALGEVNDMLLWALGGGGLAVALVGFVDDHGHLSPRVRLLVHFAAVAWALYWLCGMPPLPVGGGYVIDGPAWTVLGAVALVWLLNLYNFMDGIDGIAGVEAVCVALGAMLFGGSALWLVVAAAAGGFLLVNWPPARIFMGDVGSGFLGFVLGVLAVDAAAWEQFPLASSAVLLGVFLVDATVTLFRRWLRGERLSQAHRSHAYQHAARRFGGHRPVVLGVIAINLFWLLPWAWVAQAWPAWSMGAVLVALGPLAWLAWRLGAGTVEGRA
jgi:Fuc2NAc and GlcNAc transferase